MFLDNLAYLLWSSGKLANLETQDFPHKGSLQRRDSGPRILNSLSDWELFSNPLSPRKYNSYIFIYLFSRGRISGFKQDLPVVKYNLIPKRPRNNDQLFRLENIFQVQNANHLI